MKRSGLKVAVERRELGAGLARIFRHAWTLFGCCRKGEPSQAAEKRHTLNNHPCAQGTTPPESGGELLTDSPPQMRRGGAPSAGVVLTRGGVEDDSTGEFFRSL